MDLCRRVIRQTLNKERIEEGKINNLNLPKAIKDYLAYKDRRSTTMPQMSTLEQDGQFVRATWLDYHQYI